MEEKLNVQNVKRKEQDIYQRTKELKIQERIQDTLKEEWISKQFIKSVDGKGK